jgi:hypothetical protein
VIVHYHLFKNAGKSIDRALREELVDRWIPFDKPDPGAKISPAEMEEFILDHPYGAAFSSHQVVPPLPARQLQVLPIVFLRHPIDRAYSAYLFEWKVQKETAAPIGTFEEYIAEKLNGAPRRNAIEDFQALHLANWEYERGRPSSHLDDERALANARGFLRGIRCFGLVEQYDRSLEVLNGTLATHFSGLKLRPHRENVTREERSLEARMRRIRSELSPEAYSELTRRNQLDLRLYDYAERLFSAL